MIFAERSSASRVAVGQQPDSEEIQGDLPYLAPETCRYMFGEDVVLTEKVDVFSAGLLFHVYLTGALPTVDPDYDYVHEALLEGGNVFLSPKLKKPYETLIRSMIAVDPADRPDMRDVLQALSDMEKPPAPKPVLPEKPVVVPEPVKPPEPVKNPDSPWKRPTGF